jgi:hypothetical protein
MTSAHTSAPPARWAVWCAWIVPLTILPSAIWRTSMVVTDERGFARAVTEGGWYLLLLGVLSMGLGLLTVGLVRPWGEIVPRWVPRIGGRVVPARAAARVAVAGGVALILITVWFFVNRLTGPFPVPVLIDTGGPPHPQPGWDVLRYYAPVIAWGPLVIAVARNYRRRRAQRPAAVIG